MSAGAGARARVALTALLGAWVASCSADVDGYHLDPGLVGKPGPGESGGASGSTGGSAGTAGSQSGGESGAGTGAVGGSRSRDAGGPDTSLGNGGAQGGAAGATSDGGASNGGTGSGGVATGGTGTGGIIGAGGNGAGGTGTGGIVGTGGTGTGGVVGTGGTGTGGIVGTGGTGAGGIVGTGGTGAGGIVGTGGTGAGGMVGTGGTGTGGSGTVGSSDPVWMGTTVNLTGISAAAWVASQNTFYLLEPANHRFWSANVSTDPASIGGPYPLPASGTVASFAFGASATTVYVVISNSIYRLPVTGNASATPVVALGDSPANAALTGAYANGWFFLGETNGSAHALADGQTMLDASVSSLKNLYQVSTDGSSFVFRALGSPNNAYLYRMPATAPLTPSTTPCDTGVITYYLGQPSGLSGSTATWVHQPLSVGAYALISATFTGGVCGTSSSPISYGAFPTGGTFSGLIDTQYALIPSMVSGGSATITLVKFGGGFTPRSVANVYFGAKAPYGIVMGTPHHAVVLSGDVPALISY